MVENFDCPHPLKDFMEITVQEKMMSPAEVHDQCNIEELDPELECDMLDVHLTCRPKQCGLTNDRFKCDCNVDHG